jgi:hypothetical protein
LGKFNAAGKGSFAMASGERRREPRYVVDAVNLVVGGRSYPVIDISPSSARISCPPRDYAQAGETSMQFEFNSEGGRRDVFTIKPRLIRLADLYVVIGFEPPRTDWEAYIRNFDTFHVHELDDQLFD